MFSDSLGLSDGTRRTASAAITPKQQNVILAGGKLCELGKKRKRRVVKGEIDERVCVRCKLGDERVWILLLTCYSSE